MKQTRHGYREGDHFILPNENKCSKNNWNKVHSIRKFIQTSTADFQPRQYWRLLTLSSWIRFCQDKIRLQCMPKTGECPQATSPGKCQEWVEYDSPNTNTIAAFKERILAFKKIYVHDPSAIDIKRNQRSRKNDLIKIHLFYWLKIIYFFNNLVKIIYFEFHWIQIIYY